MILRGRLNGIQRNRLKGLYDMLYSPKELSDEIGMNKNQVYYVYVPLGCPVQRDKQNHIYINGKAFAEWYTKSYIKIRLKENETFCLTCKKPVTIIQPSQHTKGGLTYLLSACPVCHRTLTKIISYDK